MRIGLLAIAFLICLSTISQAQSLSLAYEKSEGEKSESDYKYYLQPVSLRWASDEWTGTDKVHHLLGGFGTTSLSAVLWPPKTDQDVWKMAGYNVLFWGLWEVKDAVFPWEFWSRVGGDGFSYKDWAWSIAGVGIGTALIFLVK